MASDIILPFWAILACFTATIRWIRFSHRGDHSSDNWHDRPLPRYHTANLCVFSVVC